jgi:hypothetical protein
LTAANVAIKSEKQPLKGWMPEEIAFFIKNAHLCGQ